MQFRVCVCVFLLVLVTVNLGDAKKSYSSRRKSGNSRRGSSSSSQPKPPPPQPSSTNHKTDSNTNFLNAERTATSHGAGSVNMHHRQTPFSNKPPEPPKQSVPQTSGPIGFEKINSEVQRKPAASNVPSAPAYPAGSPPYMSNGATYPGKTVGNAPNGAPPAYPGYASPGNSFDPPPAYPGRPVNAPPVYSPSNQPTSFGQRNPAQPGFGGYPNQQGGFAPQGPYQGQSYPGQQNFGYPHGGSNFGQSNPAQQGFGYSNTGANFGNYPNQGFGSYPNGGFGNNQHGYGQSHSGFGGSPFGGSPFGGSPMSGSYGNSHYSPNNFGYSNNPGFFGSQYGHNNMFGQHKKSRFGGLPIPIPIPIPIPLGGFGGFGGHSHSHRVLDTFVKNQNISNTSNTTTNIYLLNNSTVTPCTTDQFIYDSLNITVMSCTTGNCTAVKIFVTSNATQDVSVRSAGLTMCLEPNATYSVHADNVNPTVSDLHQYWMRVCREIVNVNTTDQKSPNVTVKVSEEVLNETVISNSNSTDEKIGNITIVPESNNSTKLLPNSTENITSMPLQLNATIANTTDSNCETFSCSWLEMCLPSIETVTKMSHQPCIRIKMCQSPSTPISTFATLNNTISRFDQFNNISTFSDVANLTLVSYLPPNAPSNCSQNATDPACKFPLIQDVCAPGNTSEATVGGTGSNSANCTPPAVSEATSSTLSNVNGSEATSSTMAPP